MGKEQGPNRQSGSESEVKAQPEPVERGVMCECNSVEDVSYDIALYAHHNKYDGNIRSLREYIEGKVEQYIAVRYEST
jgi:hypothetical protein